MGVDLISASVCGAIAQYDFPGSTEGPNRLPDLLKLLLYRFIKVRGFATPDHFDSFPEFLAEDGPCVAQGKIKYRSEFIGIDAISEAFIRLFGGPHEGKLIAGVG
ncbi:hypothetical protein [Pseudomonas petrae]|uniref:Uncharacterized protein n=1 Tax=Pseudomonas petrae TaxID=2912190 RepID=A0ABS9I995_9PSED|nr:hypothetical protein [Pseudomonas petrae]MCF7533632.1 hypothetical protein [Pseudomonas petrae]MCF7539616.1 hypothetical protein [Pseudomonas petrae]MCF7543929.1 hypothetical protein [Pseudomonas petrae]